MLFSSSDFVRVYFVQHYPQTKLFKVYAYCWEMKTGKVLYTSGFFNTFNETTSTLKRTYCKNKNIYPFPLPYTLQCLPVIVIADWLRPHHILSHYPNPLWSRRSIVSPGEYHPLFSITLPLFLARNIPTILPLTYFVANTWKAISLICLL